MNTYEIPTLRHLFINISQLSSGLQWLCMTKLELDISTSGYQAVKLNTDKNEHAIDIVIIITVWDDVMLDLREGVGGGVDYFIALHSFLR